jgi:hypothetical protein
MLFFIAGFVAYDTPFFFRNTNVMESGRLRAMDCRAKVAESAGKALLVL